MGEVLFCFPSGQCQAFLLYSRIEWSENKIINNALVMPILGRYYIQLYKCVVAVEKQNKNLQPLKNIEVLTSYSSSRDACLGLWGNTCSASSLFT